MAQKGVKGDSWKSGGLVGVLLSREESTQGSLRDRNITSWSCKVAVFGGVPPPGRLAFEAPVAESESGDFLASTSVLLGAEAAEETLLHPMGEKG